MGPTLRFVTVEPTVKADNDEIQKTLAVATNGFHEVYVFETHEDITKTWKQLAYVTIPGLENTDAIRIRSVKQYKSATVLFVTEFVNSKGHVILAIHELDLGTSQLNSSQKLSSNDTCVNLQFCELLSPSKLAMISDKPILPESCQRSTAYTFEQSPTSIKVNFNVSEDSAISFRENIQELCSEIVSGELYAPVKNWKIENDSCFVAEKVDRDILWPGLFKSEDNPEVTMKVDGDAVVSMDLEEIIEILRS